ncbi:MAG: TonB-dependent receptor [Armatimonadota bacterium]|nr:TonB-dependent receptor [Armatimonadota bacterium]
MNIEITSASKTPEKMSDTPASVFVITREDIQRFGYRTIDEALQRIVGVLTSNDRTWQFTGIRGISRPGDFNTRILFLVDGHRVNDMQFSNARTDEGFPVDIESVERIEFVKGPGSALWGPNAELAVINVLTKQGKNADGLRTIVEYGTFNRRKAYVEYGDKYPSGLDVFVSASGIATDGEHRIFIEEWADEPGKNGGMAVNGNAMDAAHTLLSAHYGSAKLLFARSRRSKGDLWGDYDLGTFPVGAAGHFTDHRSLLELSYEATVSKKRNSRILARVFLDENKFEYFEFPLAGGESESHSWLKYDWPLMENYWRDGAKTEGLEVRYSLDVTPNASLVTGVEYNNIRTLLTLVPFDIDPKYNIKSYFLQTDVKLGDSKRLVAGIRRDDYSNLKTSVASPRVGLVWDVTQNSSLKLLYGEAFRPPTAWEVVYIPYYNEFERPEGAPLKPPLKPETMKTYELVWDAQLGVGNRLVASLFMDTINDLIDTNLYKNVGSIVSKGAEAQFESRRRDGSRSYLSVSAVNGRNKTTGRWLDNSPRFLASGGLSIPVLSDKFYLSAEGQFVGGRRALSLDESKESYVPSYAVVNLVLATAESNRKCNVSLGIYNLFNKKYYNPASTDVPPLTITRISQEGRTMRLQVNYRF